MSAEKAERTKILELIPYGLYIVGAKGSEGHTTIVANWVCQVSFDPPLMMVSIEKDSEIRSDIERSKYFSVNMLASGQRETAKAFLKPSRHSDPHDLAGKILAGTHGSPLLRDAVAWMELKVVDSFSAGDHIVFIGNVLEAELIRNTAILTLKETGWKYSR